MFSHDPFARIIDGDITITDILDDPILELDTLLDDDDANDDEDDECQELDF